MSEEGARELGDLQGPGRAHGPGGHTRDHHHNDHHHEGWGWWIKRSLSWMFHVHPAHGPHGPHSPGAGTELGIKAVKVSLVILLATSAFQVVISVASGSVALLADTVHNLADALTSLPLWLAFWLGKRAADRRYTYGYGKAEDLAGIFIVAVIAASAGVTAWQSIDRFLNPRPIGQLAWVASAAVVGFGGNALAAVYRIRSGRRIGSAALVADGLHARADALTSLGVLLAVAGSALGWERADPIVGMVITAGILSVLVAAGRQVYERLMDAVPAGLTERAETVLAQTPGVEEVSGVKIRWVGHSLHAEARVTVDCDKSFVEAHRITEEANHALLHDLPALADAIIHADPCNHDGRDHHALTAHHFSGS